MQDNKKNTGNPEVASGPDATGSSTTNQLTGDNTIKDPDDWTTGDEPMTGAQKSYLKTLSDEAGEDFNENLTKAEASKSIENLQKKTRRGLKQNNP